MLNVKIKMLNVKMLNDWKAKYIKYYNGENISYILRKTKKCIWKKLEMRNIYSQFLSNIYSLNSLWKSSSTTLLSFSSIGTTYIEEYLKLAMYSERWMAKRILNKGEEQ